MRHLFYFFILLGCVPVFSLPLGNEGKQEAHLFRSFIQAVYATPDEPGRTFQALEKVLALEPDSKYIRRLLVSLAVSMNEPQRAKPYADFIEMGENEAEDWGVYADYQWKTGQVKAAQTAYEKALELDPENNQILYQYLVLLAALDGDKAVAELEKFARRYPALSAAAYGAIGRLYLRKQHIQTALVYLDKAVRADPTDPAPRIAKSEIYEKTSQFFLMLHELEELEKMGYANAGTLSRMGTVFMLVKDAPQAKAYFLKAKDADNTDPVSNYFLSLLAEQEGDYARAVAYLKEAADYPTKPSYWLQVSFLQQRLNRPKESLHTLEEAYTHFPGDVEVGFFYGLLLNDSKSYKKAARVFKRILQTNPDYTDARLHYAYALENLRKYKEMEKQLNLILAKQPQHTAALNLYAYSLAERNERLDEAHAYIAQALAVEKDYSYIDTQAWIYIRQGKLDEADERLSLLPEEFIKANAEVAYHMGVLRAEQGRREEALSYLEIAQKEWPAAAKLYHQLQQK